MADSTRLNARKLMAHAVQVMRRSEPEHRVVLVQRADGERLPSFRRQAAMPRAVSGAQMHPVVFEYFGTHRMQRKAGSLATRR